MTINGGLQKKQTTTNKKKKKPALQMRTMQLRWPKILLSESTASHLSSLPQPPDKEKMDDEEKIKIENNWNKTDLSSISASTY